MQTRALGAGPLEVQPVIFGAWAVGGWYWGGTDDARSVRAIQASIDAGVTAIDTAPMYGCGHSERVVGRALAGRRDAVTLMTKVGLRWDDTGGAHFFDDWDDDANPLPIHRNLSAASVRLEVDRSLERLGVEVIDLIQCHWPDPTTEVEETMDALAGVVRAGKARAIGVSNFPPALLERAAAELARHGLPLSSTQPRYSLLKRGIESDVLPWCRDHGVGAIVYSPMEQGLLTGKVGPDRVFPEDDGRGLDPAFSQANRVRVLEAIAATADICAAHGCTPAQLALAWCHHQPGVTAAIAGARTPEQAVENAKAASIQLTAEEVQRLTATFGFEIAR
jgi:aryl-alcohol dehydrogenase-like predicted oxidoreductase